MLDTVQLLDQIRLKLFTDKTGPLPVKITSGIPNCAKRVRDNSITLLKVAESVG